MGNGTSFTILHKIWAHNDFLRFTSRTVKLVCDLKWVLNFAPLRILWLLLFHGLSRKIMQSLHFLFLGFFYSVVPENTMSSWYWWIEAWRFPCSQFSVFVDIELLFRLDILVLEERKKTLVPQRLAKLKGGEGKRGGLLLASSRCQPWCSLQLAVLSSWCEWCGFYLSRLVTTRNLSYFCELESE